MRFSNPAHCANAEFVEAHTHIPLFAPLRQIPYIDVAAVDVAASAIANMHLKTAERLVKYGCFISL